MGSSSTPPTRTATELVFALFDLLGLSFIPGPRDVSELRLHRIGAPTGLPVDALLTSKIQRGTRPADPADPDQRRQTLRDAVRAVASAPSGERVLRTTLEQALRDPRALARRLEAAGAPYTDRQS